MYPTTSISVEQIRIIKAPAFHESLSRELVQQYPNVSLHAGFPPTFAEGRYSGVIDIQAFKYKDKCDAWFAFIAATNLLPKGTSVPKLGVDGKKKNL